jgi:transcriptional regulator with XRE-family HTH domain
MIGDRIRYYRELRGLTQIQLAKLVGVKHPTVSRWETNKLTNIPWERIKQIAAALDVPTGLLIGFDDLVEPDTTARKELTALLPQLTEDQTVLLLTIARQMIK